MASKSLWLVFALHCSLLVPKVSTATEKTALLIGITRYKHARMNQTRLQFPEADAQAIGKQLKASGFEVKTLLGPDATQQNVRTALDQISASGSDGGVVLIGLFGHGLQYGDKAYFAPHDTRVRIAVDAEGNRVRNSAGQLQLEATPESMVSMQDVLDTLAVSGASNRVLLADCSHEPPAKKGDPTFGSELKVGDLVPGTAVLLSSGPGQQSYEHKDWGHGAFAQTLLQTTQSINDEMTATQLADALRRGVAHNVADKTNGQRRQTVTPIVNGSVELGLAPVPTAPASVVTNTLGMKFHRIQPGSFEMGSHESPGRIETTFKENPEFFRNEHPLRTIKIQQPFYMGATEVTYAQFERFVRSTGYSTSAEHGAGGKAATAVELSKNATWRSPEGTAPNWEHPVTMLTYHDAKAFCDWLTRTERKNYRLPTDEEWEYAARAGTRTRYWNGDDPRKLVEIANIPDIDLFRAQKGDTDRTDMFGSLYVDTSDGFVGLAPVGSFPANPWGLHDVHGNVWEWCTVTNVASLKVADAKDVAVIRGGCFY